MFFPSVRMRRLRSCSAIRALVRETVLTPDDFVQPLFICPGKNVKQQIESMPGIFRMSVDLAVKKCVKIRNAGIKSIILFGIPEKKDETGEVGCRDDGIVQQAIRAIKKEIPDIYIITDVCNCEYTTHGHCGFLVDGVVDNDKTLQLLGRQALSHAKAGVDMVAPSDMMDGRVGYIRDILDHNGYQDIPIMSYAVKYASSFYGPFREAAQSAPGFGDRNGYQMDYSNSREGIREAFLDIDEGADIIMVKPAMSYLDIVLKIKENSDVPVAAYNVSGEYSMVKAANEKGWIDGQKVMMEILTSIKRAGADIIISYHSVDAVSLLAKGWY
ncbi:MAG TPA: porphobilinogen synthase [Chitinispirillaceae bacterium]|nr:porphobilinogen synthase [Chitinispirillaceae bacterium]